MLLPDVADLSDSELVNAEDIDVNGVFWASVSPLEWKAILYFKYKSAFLDRCEDFTPDGVQNWLDSVSSAYAEIVNSKPKRGTGMGARGRDPTRGAGGKKNP